MVVSSLLGESTSLFCVQCFHGYVDLNMDTLKEHFRSMHEGNPWVLCWSTEIHSMFDMKFNDYVLYFF